MTVTYNIKIKIPEKPKESDNTKENDADANNVPTDATDTAETDSTLLEIEEIGKTLQEFDLQQTLPPMHRYKKKNKLSVTDFSAQLWCEQQLEFTLTTGRKRETEAMKSGTARHEALERADHDIVEVEVETREENLAFRLLNGINLLELLFEKGKSREVWVFGVFEDVLVRGVIDELSLVNTADGKQLLLSDTKTRRQESEPSPAQKRTSAIQLQVYNYVVTELREGRGQYDALCELYQVDRTYEFTMTELLPYKNLDTLIGVYKSLFERLPPVRQKMEIVYECEGKEFAKNEIPYYKEATLFSVFELLDWWKGARDTDIVLSNESWKCKFCEFLDMCTKTPLSAEIVSDIIQKRHEEELKKLQDTLITDDLADDLAEL